jgi:hypothetical protein
MLEHWLEVTLLVATVAFSGVSSGRVAPARSRSGCCRRSIRVGYLLRVQGE